MQERRKMLLRELDVKKDQFLFIADLSMLGIAAVVEHRVYLIGRRHSVGRFALNCAGACALETNCYFGYDG